MSVRDSGEAAREDGRSYLLQIYPRLAAPSAGCCSLQVPKDATATAVVQDATLALGLDPGRLYVLAEVKQCGGEEWVLEAGDLPVQRVLLWPRRAQEPHPPGQGFYFLLQERNNDGSICYVHLQALSREREAQRLAARGFLPPRQDDCDDLCNLPVLNEDSILDNLRNRFHNKKIYTYAGSILIAINPFKFLPIYNPKYVKMYENHQLGKLEPHIFAIADVSYYAMLRTRVNQCIVISGESGSGKTQSTNFLIHCLTALSQKGYASGVERTILGAGPVLEAFGNAKTAHNNNSSRFGKFIQVNYLESGVVRGAVVEKYLLEKSRLVSREKNERNYHVFYYLLLGASEEERREFKLLQPEEYLYLRQENFRIEDEEDLRHDFERLQQAMEMVGFLAATKKQIFSVLSAILYLGNVTYKKKATGREEGLDVGPPEVLATLSDLLQVKEELLVEALTKRKTVTVNDKLILPYSHSEAITARDSMAKSLYSALFDWIVLRINHALLNKKDMEESVPCLSIGVLDIFGFEDFATNSFEQFCINYANEQLQYYFNQHIFKLEQEEYQGEGITWHNIDYTDNVGCIHLISRKPTGLLYLLDEESNFPHATDKTLLAKFKQQHQGNRYFVPTPVMEPAFVIQHFAGRVKYQITDFREKNTDHMRPDIVALLRSSDRAFIRQLIGMDPVAMFRWAVLRAAVRGLAGFNQAGSRRAARTAGVVRPTSRTPLGELQRSNPPVERIYKRASLLDFYFDPSDESPLEAFEDIFASYERKKKNKTSKQKQSIPKSLLDSKSLKFIVGLTLQDRTTKSLMHLHKKKKPPSISAQFQTSLTKLLETLGKAEPFFIRCIRSNAEKKEMYLDKALVVQQLRYTGMLETVRIRRSGYGAKYTFQEFMEQFRVLLPRTASACRDDISVLLENMCLDHTTYQIGKTKVYLKELERQQLQDTLHKEVMRRILILQRWLRAHLERKNFLDMRQAAILIQRWWRTYLKEERRRQAACLIQAVWRGWHQRSNFLLQRDSATRIQSAWRGWHQRSNFLLQRHSATRIQALARGHSARRRCHSIREEKREEVVRRTKEEEEARRRKEEAAWLAREAEREAEDARAREEEEAARRRQAAQEALTKKLETEAANENLVSGANKKLVKESQDEDDMSVASPLRREEEEEDEGLGEEEERRTNPDIEANGSQSEATAQLEEEPRPEKTQSEGPRPKTTTLAAVSPGAPQQTHTGRAFPLDAHADGQPGQSKPRPPQLHRGPASRSQEKRELRRQRGLEHSQRESQRAASREDPSPPTREDPSPPTTDPSPPTTDPSPPTSEDPSPPTREDPSTPTTEDLSPPPKVKGPQAPSGTEVKLKERADSKELDQYTFVAWKGKREDQGRREDQREARSLSSPGPARPTSLPLQQSSRNGHGEAVGLQRYQRPGGMKEKEKWRGGRRSDGGGSPALPLSKDDRKKKPLQTQTSSEGSSPGSAQHSATSNTEVLSPADCLSDVSKSSSIRRTSQSSPAPPDSCQPLATTPERSSGFLRKILKKKPPKEPQTLEDGDQSQTLAERAAGSGPVGEAALQLLSRPQTDGRALERNPTLKISRATRVTEKWNASLDREITNANELRHLDEFLGNQVNDLRSRGKQLSATEHIFINATMQFRETIKGMYSLPKPHIGYKGLMKGYQHRVVSLAGDRQQAEVPLVVNLFQSILDGFIRGEIKKEEAEPAKPAKARKKRRKKDKSLDSPLDHMFSSYQVNIMQSCDQCTSYIWGMEKAYMCSYCKMVCHKKCLSKIVTDCSTFCTKKSDEEPSGLHFGVRVCHLTSDKNPVPVVMEMMLEHVEMNGLYTEGIYRKSGSANRMKELHQILESGPGSVCLEDYPLHTVTGLVKQWLRELPDPLMTFNHYSDFLRAVELPDRPDQLHAIYKVLEQLPSANFNTLERLIFHLVRVSKEEAHNRMSPNSLAIVFAPCILRCPDSADPLLSMKDVAKTTTCVEMLIREQIRRYNEKMEEIEQLEFAEALAVNQLRLNRQNTHWRLPLRFSPPYRGEVVHEKEKATSDLCAVPEDEPLDSDTESKSLMERIKSIKQEKEDLACRLPELEQPGSDQENLDSEASVSSESLLEERAQGSEAEGGGSMLRRSKPPSLPKPSELSLRLQPCSGASSPPPSSPPPSSLSSSSPFGSAFRLQLQRRQPLLQPRTPAPASTRAPPSTPAPVSASTHASIPAPQQPSASGSALSGRGLRGFGVVRRREQPGRRKDVIQSVYIKNPREQQPPAASSTPGFQAPGCSHRRHSNPDFPP
ncbi:unconventional myosin-IXb [Hypomesus transpacificus]|uniref:unconventional myosin-IXb n=1 Tax=Hypomesus transpacificus TaxID=137520 RepID=UPI001F0803CC|nr:unconventional myosin-IXb [Hypomesus transpacificus]